MAAKKYLITSSSCFVAQHFLGFLEKRNSPTVALGLDREPLPERQDFRHLSFSFKAANVIMKGYLR